MKNVIDLSKRLNKQAKRQNPGVAADESDGAVIDMTEKRNEILVQERRQVRRTILSEFIGAMALVPQKGLVKVTMYDISEDGVAFDVEDKVGHFLVGEEVAMRLYLNHQTYFPFIVRIQNIRGVDEERTFRHGANFVKGTINDLALHHFVKFIESVSASLKTDSGDLMVSNLTR